MTAQIQKQRQADVGNRIIIEIQIENKRIKSQSFSDLTVGGTTDKDWVIDQYHRYSSTNHYHEGMEENPEKFYNGIKTVELINDFVKKLNNCPNGTVCVVTEISRKKEKRDREVMTIDQFNTLGFSK